MFLNAYGVRDAGSLPRKPAPRNKLPSIYLVIIGRIDPFATWGVPMLRSLAFYPVKLIKQLDQMRIYNGKINSFGRERLEKRLQHYRPVRISEKV